MSTTTPSDSDDGSDSPPNYRHEQRVPECVLSACLYALGMQQWLSPNADGEYASEARKVCQGLYAAVLINHGQYDQDHRFAAEPDWDSLRQFRDYIFDDHYYVPELFNMTDFETPDDMFDAVEAELVAHDLLHDTPPEREQQYVTSDDV